MIHLVDRAEPATCSNYLIGELLSRGILQSASGAQGIQTPGVRPPKGEQK